jgi:transglutaminase-like putative cysteine protease
MKIKIGFEITFEAPQPTPMVILLNVHPSRQSDLLTSYQITTNPLVPIRPYHDSFGNECGRLFLPPGRTMLSYSGIVRDTGQPDPVTPSAQQIAVQDLPDQCILYLLPSRYCETDRLVHLAWSLFKDTPPGWPRVQAICDYVHNRLVFGYGYARPTRTAREGHIEGRGVCRDFAHLAITFCRCMNIPARYCTGYLGDIGVPPVDEPMDFSAWFEAYLGGQWYTFDARYNIPRIGRVLVARGRDATDVAISTTFAPSKLIKFDVLTDEVKE